MFALLFAIRVNKRLISLTSVMSFCMLEGSRDSSLLPLQACVFCFVGVKHGGGALLGGGVPDLAKFATLYSLS